MAQAVFEKLIGLSDDNGEREWVNNNDGEGEIMISNCYLQIERREKS